MRLSRFLVFAGLSLIALTLPLAAAADHKTRPHTKNIHALGHSPHPASFFGATPAERNINSDIAFWENYVFHGNYDGFRILRDAPGNPKEISWTHCNGDQGDIVVWENVLVRAWNSPAPAGRFCDGAPVPAGFEGMHIFDISDLENPVLVGDVELSARPGADSPGCGTHTLTAVPDLTLNRLIIYNATSGGNSNLPNPADRACDWIDIVQVPLATPGAATHLRREPVVGNHAVHDNGVILGNVNLLAAASGDMANVFSIGPPRGGTVEDPLFLYTIMEPGVCNAGDPVLCNGNWHSAAFSWDGRTIILGWEPGGGAAPECEATDPPVKKSAFFYSSSTGAKLGQWTLPRPQSSTENCTIHNFNAVPLRTGRDVLVLGNYQAGTWVVDFTNPASARTVAWSDPPPLGNVTTPGGVTRPELGGAWSTYWYNNFLWESEITKGMNVFRVSDRRLAAPIILDHLNPQTQEFSLPR
ncbi:MAG: hypothetical protein M3377_07190 [Actinomycetota bacterium]|nr:hypothetical protein [Actinomycetota bacterium]